MKTMSVVVVVVVIRFRKKRKLKKTMNIVVVVIVVVVVVIVVSGPSQTPLWSLSGPSQVSLRFFLRLHRKYIDFHLRLAMPLKSSLTLYVDCGSIDVLCFNQ